MTIVRKKKARLCNFFRSGLSGDRKLIRSRVYRLESRFAETRKKNNAVVTTSYSPAVFGDIAGVDTVFFCGFLEDDSCIFSLLGVDNLKKLIFCLENDSE